MKRHLQPLLLLLLSAVLYVLAFPPYDFWILGWICLVPGWMAIERSKNWKEGLFYGAVLQFLICILGFYWVAHVLSEYGRLPFALGIVGLLGFGLIGQPQFLVMGLLIRQWNKISESRAIHPIKVAGMFAALYAGIDFILPKLFVDTLGHSLYKVESLRQVATLGGVPLLSFLMVLINLCILEWIKLFLKERSLRVWSQNTSQRSLLFVASLLVVSSIGFGAYESHRWKALTEEARNSSSVSLAGIQANIGDLDKFASEQGVGGVADRIVKRYLDLSKVALESNSGVSPSQAFIWPETAYPSTFGTPDTSGEVRRDSAVKSFVSEYGVPLWFGGYDREGRKDFNAMFFLSRSESDLSLTSYRKNILLLFGEYLPGSEWFPALKHAFPQVGNFGKGNGPEVYPLPLSTRDPRHTLSVLRVAPAICYEVLFSDFIREQARSGAELLVNITNDSWFGLTSEPLLHLALTTFRAVETRRPLLRVTNTGISALIDPDGTIRAQSGQNRPEVFSVQVPILTTERRSQELSESGVVKWGPWSGPVLLILGLSLFGWFYFRGRTLN